MSDLHDEISVWRRHLAGERPKTIRSPIETTMPYLGEFVGE